MALMAVVEFHGFKDNNNRFVVKEFAVVSKYFQTQMIFKQPYSESSLSKKMQNTARWLTKHFHFMKWNDEGLDFNDDIIRTVLSVFSTVYTKGTEKVEFLRQFHDNVENIEGPSAQGGKLKVPCLLPQHNGHNGRCALRSAKAFYTLKRQEKI